MRSSTLWFRTKFAARRGSHAEHNASFRGIDKPQRFYPSVVGTADTVDSKPTAFGRESATLSRRTKLGASSPDTFRSDDLIVLDSAFESRVEPH